MSETYVLHLEREIGVTNLKPGHVRVYDYYHPGEWYYGLPGLSGYLCLALYKDKFCLSCPVAEEQALTDYNVFCI